MKKLFFSLIIIFLIFDGSFLLAQKSAVGDVGEKKLNREAEEATEIKSKANFINLSLGEKVAGKIKPRLQVKGADSVEFYLQRPESLIPIYAGSGIFVEDTWGVELDTTKIPNGRYLFYPKIFNRFGEYSGTPIEIEVSNAMVVQEGKKKEIEETVKKTEEESVKKEEELKQIQEKAVKEIAEIVKTSNEEVKTKAKELEVAEKIEEEMEEVAIKVHQGSIALKEKTQEEKKLKNEEEKREEMIKEVEKEAKEAGQAIEKLQKNKEVTQKIKEEIVFKKEKEKEEKPKQKLEKQEVKIIQEIKEIQLVHEEKKEKLKEAIEKKDQLEKEIKEIREKSQNLKTEKEQIKSAIVEEVKKPLVEVKSIVKEEVKPKIAEEVKKIKEKTIAGLEKFEKEVSAVASEIIEIKTQLLIDSDKDGLSDAEEIKIGTDPLNPDSDGDGFTDEVEVALGFDPLNPSPADKIVYQNPQKAKPEKTDIYKITRVVSAALPTGETGAKLEGKGLPNSFVTIHIFSTPVILTTKTDGNGNWEYILDKPLADGSHVAYVAATNNSGEIIGRSEAFLFTKAENKITAVLPFISEEGIPSSPAEVLQRTFILLIVSLIVLAIGIALIVIGVLGRKKNGFNISNNLPH